MDDHLIFSRKRKRADTLQEAPASLRSAPASKKAQLRQKLNELSPTFIKSTLLAVALQRENVAQMIQLGQRNHKNLRKPIIGFERERRQIMEVLNSTQHPWQGNSPYHDPKWAIRIINMVLCLASAAQVNPDVLQDIEIVAKQASHSEVFWTTKEDALATLLNVGETICSNDHPSHLKRAIKKDILQTGGRQWVIAMGDITRSMSYDDRELWLECRSGREWARRTKALNRREESTFVLDSRKEGTYALDTPEVAHDLFGLQNVYKLLGLDGDDPIFGSDESDDAWATDQDDIIQKPIASIVDQAAGDNASFGTKKNALETMRKIGKSICLGPADSLMREVRNVFASFSGTQYVAGMKAIVYSTSEDDWPDWIASGGATEWMEKIQELVGLAEGYMLFQGLEKVSDWMELGGEDEDGGEDSEDEDEDEDDDDDDDRELEEDRR